MSTLKTFIQALDPKTLPRVLRILSGVYYQGSIYELFGNECCLPTGEEIKVIGIKINKITASFYNYEDNKGQEIIDLPLDFPGFFQIEADTTPYLSIEEIASTVPIGPIRFGHPCYYSSKDVKLPKIIIKSGEKIMFHSVGEVDGVMSVKCEILRDGQHHPFALALSYRGEFFECSDDQIYSLNEIAEWKIPRNRKRTVLLHSLLNTYENTASPFPDRFKGSIVLSTVYELQAVMKYFAKTYPWQRPGLKHEEAFCPALKELRQLYYGRFLLHYKIPTADEWWSIVISGSNIGLVLKTVKFLKVLFFIGLTDL